MTAELRECKEHGYEFHLVYVWLPSPEMAIERVQARVRSGGHNIPDDTIRRRYEAGRLNFVKLYLPLADTWAVYDNEHEQFEVVAQGQAGHEPVIFNARVWQQVNA